VTSVPDITRLLARIEDWKGQGPALGRAEAARRLDEAHKLLDEVSDMLTGGHCWAPAESTARSDTWVMG
jgi:hypothetical protein